MSKNSHLKLICFTVICFVFVSSSVFLWALVSKNYHLKLVCFKLICFVSVSSVLFLSSCGPWCQKTLIFKLICFASVSSLLFLSSCEPWCQKTLMLSWFALLLSLLCSVCLLVGLGVKKTLLLCFCLFCALSVFLWALVSKNSQLKLICFVSVSSVLFLSSCGPWCQKTSHLKLIGFVSVSSVFFLSSCGPWCQKTLILS